MPLGIYTSNAFRNASGVQVVPNANVEVRRESDGALASIFSTRNEDSNTEIDQVGYPGTTGFKADADGYFEFHAAGIADGYRVRIYSDDLSLDKTLRYQPTGTAREFDVDPFWANVWLAATKLAARIALKVVGLDGLFSRATNTILTAADSGKAIVVTGSFTQTFDPAADLDADWHVHYRVDAGQTVTFDPDGAELIDGATTKVVVGPAAGYIVCDGLAFHTFGFDQPNASTTARGIVELATQAEADAGTADKAHTTDLNKIALGTPIDTSTGAVLYDFTGIPAGTREITFGIAALSTNGTSVPILQLGDAGGFEVTGYDGAASSLGSGVTTAEFTTGFSVGGSAGNAAHSRHGKVTLTLIDESTNTWAIDGGPKLSLGVTSKSAGTKALTGELTQLRLTTVNGSDTFDAGSVNIAYER